eukprot:CAMPEP_0204326024 /NCGR_PEP_ID=MMETSP0469-20131031/11467_1 /ASSEMBLY_ACC=CAM_ASM_000384 /TAXON_ID=2969 /ORGANISM="Oxyrrhis marina" /LENGTH=44 /DNA_ID= /DNA_START= /DNA_END= /DNA_ORIENTATION=
MTQSNNLRLHTDGKIKADEGCMDRGRGSDEIPQEEKENGPSQRT